MFMSDTSIADIESAVQPRARNRQKKNEQLLIRQIQRHARWI